MCRHPNWGHPDHDACGTGFVARLGAAPAHDIVEFALTALERLTHRGGVDADGASGDGAGLLTSLPKEFFRARALEEGVQLPEAFGLGFAFLAAPFSLQARSAIHAAAEAQDLEIVAWRRVPIDPSTLGTRARESMPEIWQFYVEAEKPGADFERQLALLRKRSEPLLPPRCYICSLSSQLVVYKGLLTPWQFSQFYEDLRDPSFTATFAVFHQRYSTNTQPSWDLAQPFRHVAHNGEINTILSNRRWTRARERELRTRLGVDDWFAALEQGVSDSASFDNAFELKLLEGYTPAAAMLALVPPAFEKDPHLSRDVRAALRARSRDGEPWDGPAALVFYGGGYVGAKLDRNGLRPLRYTVTHDGLIMAGSETGLIDVPESNIAERQKLGPGEMILASPEKGIFLRWRDILKRLAEKHGELTATAPLPNAIPAAVPASSETAPAGTPFSHAKRVATAAGWTDDQFKILFSSLTHGKEADWSMGDDAPPAFLSTLSRTLWDYCKQRFAQVTNPPIDPLRESHVMSLDVYLGRDLVIDSPVLDAGQTAVLENLLLRPVHIVDLTFYAADGVQGAQAAIERIRDDIAEAMITEPAMILLTDRDATEKRAAVPVLLAVAAAWKEIVRSGGHRIPIVVETGQVIETHHIALLVAVGASAVYPYLAMELAENVEPGGAAKYRVAVEAGFRKVLARMGISTVASYRNSHLFETIGLDEEICDEFFEDASTSLGGRSLDDILETSIHSHLRAFAAGDAPLQDSGLYRFRHAGERHSTSPDLVRRMHRYIKSATPENYASFAELSRTREAVAVRDQLEIVPGAAISLGKVEPESAILSRFCAQAMSLGALGPETHRAIAIGMNRLGARSNTGEGGEDPDVWRFEPEAANKVKQIASARFGVTAEYLVRAEEIEIKMAQGSKPGEGGQLPAMKVNGYIARLRHAVPGMSLISPPPHHDIYSIEDLAQLIYDLRAVNPRARIGVKLVSGAGVGIIAAGVAKAGADVITIAGFDGGTGASPLTSIKNTGLPWENGLRDADTVLLRAGFRERVRLRVDGGFKFGRDVVIAALLGADEFGFGTSTLLAVGCIMARQCHLNTCPVGNATEDEKLRARFAGKPEMVMAYFRGVAGEVRERMAQLGVHSLSDLTGWYDRLSARSGMDPLLIVPMSESNRVAPHQSPALHAAAREDALQLSAAFELQTESQPIQNSDRSIGAGMSGELMRRRRPGSQSP